MRKLLLPFSLLYWLGVLLRNWFFEKGFLKETRVAVPVISVGNISSGGVGKTPIVEMLAERFMDNGTVAVVSRGYKRKSKGTVIVSDAQGKLAPADQAGDEPFQLARKYPRCIVIVDEQRVRGAIKAMELGAKVIILDDGFQHRYLARDVNIAVLAVDELKKSSLLLPAGNRREPLASLQRSDLIVLTRCADRATFDVAGRRLIRFGKPIAGMRIRVRNVKQVSTGRSFDAGSLAEKRALLFSGIGNPGSFELVVKECGIQIERHLQFPDHHWYGESELHAIAKTFEDLQADCLLTTEKDIARIEKEKIHLLFNDVPLYVVEVEQQIIAGQESFDRVLNTIDRRI